MLNWIIGKCGRVYNARTMQYFQVTDRVVQFAWLEAEYFLEEVYTTPERAQRAFDELLDAMSQNETESRIYRMLSE